MEILELSGVKERTEPKWSERKANGAAVSKVEFFFWIPLFHAMLFWFYYYTPLPLPCAKSRTYLCSSCCLQKQNDASKVDTGKKDSTDVHTLDTDCTENTEKKHEQTKGLLRRSDDQIKNASSINNSNASNLTEMRQSAS